jgi:xanthine dehydrogenase/oxidase
LLTGDQWILRTDVVPDDENSINPGIDINQQEGGLVQGIGCVTTEDFIEGDEKNMRI